MGWLKHISPGSASTGFVPWQVGPKELTRFFLFFREGKHPFRGREFCSGFGFGERANQTHQLKITKNPKEPDDLLSLPFETSLGLLSAWQVLWGCQKGGQDLAAVHPEWLFRKGAGVPSS